MIKRMNKRGAESQSVPIWLIVALIAAVIIILFVFGAFGKIENLFGTAKDIEVMAQACSQYAANDLKTSYCNTFEKVEIEGRTQYVNCRYLSTKAEVENKEKMTCEGEENTIKEFCKNKNFDKEYVNEETCDGWAEVNNAPRPGDALP